MLFTMLTIWLPLFLLAMLTLESGLRVLSRLRRRQALPFSNLLILLFGTLFLFAAVFLRPIALFTRPESMPFVVAVYFFLAVCLVIRSRRILERYRILRRLHRLYARYARRWTLEPEFERTTLERFEGIDRAFYEEALHEFEKLGFTLFGDFENRTANRLFPETPYCVRHAYDAEGIINLRLASMPIISFLHTTRGHLPWRELVTFFSDGTMLATVNSATLLPYKYTLGISVLACNEQTHPMEMLRLHREMVNELCRRPPLIIEHDSDPELTNGEKRFPEIRIENAPSSIKPVAATTPEEKFAFIERRHRLLAADRVSKAVITPEEFEQGIGKPRSPETEFLYRALERERRRFLIRYARLRRGE